jgi:DNA-directed RNA polymerase sigma subunit (sigma70/sigma32)
MVSLRYGLDGRGEHSCQELARLNGLSYERVRVLINRAVWKMAQCGVLEDYRLRVREGMAA